MANRDYSAEMKRAKMAGSIGAKGKTRYPKGIRRARMAGSTRAKGSWSSESALLKAMKGGT